MLDVQRELYPIVPEGTEVNNMGKKKIKAAVEEVLRENGLIGTTENDTYLAIKSVKVSLKKPVRRALIELLQVDK